MASEIEIKARCEDLDAVRKRLGALGAEMKQAGLERNVVFDKPEGLLRARDSLLRLRMYNGRAVVTYKGPRSPRADAVKHRLEIETEVADFEAAAAIFQRLGFARAWAYEKQRERWTLEDVSVFLDHLPVIGDFVEIEGPDEASVLSALERLTIPKDDVTAQTYLEIFRAKCSGGSGALKDMVFESEEAR